MGKGQIGIVLSLLTDLLAVMRLYVLPAISYLQNSSINSSVMADPLPLMICNKLADTPSEIVVFLTVVFQPDKSSAHS